MSQHNEYFAVRRPNDVVKLKLRTLKRLYAPEVEPTKVEEVIKKLQCEIRKV